MSRHTDTHCDDTARAFFSRQQGHHAAAGLPLPEAPPAASAAPMPLAPIATASDPLTYLSQPVAVPSRGKSGDADELQTSRPLGAWGGRPTLPFRVPWAGLTALLPVAALAWFWFSAVPNRYLSQAEVLIKHSAPASAELKLNLLAPLGNDSARQDAYSIREFILSERMLRELDSRFDLVQRYQQNALETRLPLDGEAPVREDMLDYYRRLITVRYDENTALITVQAQDFSPVLAQQLLRYILMRSERFMNNLSNQIAGNQVAFAQAEVERAKKKLETAAQRVQQFQDRTGVLNPSAPVEGVHALVAQMQSELAQETLALQKYRSYLTDASPRVQASLTTVASLKAMIANEQQKLAGPGPSASGKLNHVAQDFEKLKFDLEFWKQNYEVALKALETARTEAARQLKFLVLVTPPSRPERSEAPNRWYLLALAAVASGLMVGTLRLVWGTIQDHRI